MDIDEAKDLKRQLEIDVMKMIHAFEAAAGLRITKAEMINFEDTRFFTSTAWLPPKLKRKEG